ncbi:uncharacterized protein EAF01_001274 [Botrytis porri]|uniref:Ketoreductase (KR) domain-containing protein n=1 Tax=Botrytis porri TaxID=87229 RepID=A0A4Z1KAX2_9HELO|nr:uncharacterized protein EAF01_001274 [Botrytis porri]KAF7912253.1 hypothetical protein EAF01_001274 [Botrytis porri]TGO82516.1 hypothetical protein BPOR_0814g00020 [Botrytis porri]
MASSKQTTDTGRVHEGKVAIVTGSARSIGAGIARNLASKGANILISYLTEASDSSAAELAEELTKNHGVVAVPCRSDISTPEGCAAIIEACNSKMPPNANTNKLQIDILINCAAIMIGIGPLESVTHADFIKSYETNVLAPILLTGACKPYLPTDRSGRIVNVSSIGQKVGTPYLTLYNGTKGALEAMTRTWSRELAENATVNTINPGSVLTDMFRQCSNDVLAAQAQWSPLIPLSGVREWDTEEVKAVGKKWGGRPAYVEEIASIVGMVCSPESAWMTGSVVSANGGQCFST